MAYQALYRKYRPQTFADVVGQPHITKTLQNELSSGKVVHAYLFTGTRGTGKTTCAKILAKAVNCVHPKDGNPCGECDICRMAANDEITDIVEMDAASNNGVDDIRELREQVNFVPVTAKYRVYIIDEVHMLTGQAFNALLKTLEEPPEHVVFILATTEVHKLPATILSRCQRFDFRRIDSGEICARLKSVAEKENLDLTDDAATLIASAADGGMRDALSILDLCASHNNTITEDTVTSVCSMAGNDYLIKMANLIKSHNTEQALLLIDQLHNSSVDMLRLLAELIQHFRNLMIVKVVTSEQKPIVCSAAKMRALKAQAENFEITEIMSILSVLQAATANMQSGNRRCEMEMTVIRLCNPQIRQDPNSLEQRIASLESKINNFNFSNVKSTVTNTAEPITAENDMISPPTDDDVVKTDETIAQKPLEKAPVSYTDNGIYPVNEWNDILLELQKSCPIVAGVLKDSSAYIEGDRLLIDSKNSQFKTLVNGSNATYRNSIRKAAQQVLGKVYKLGPYVASAKVNDNSDPLADFAQKLKLFENN